jgi:nitrate reductase assembly molybdenum cofactor insertion protein NarJ
VKRIYREELDKAIAASDLHTVRPQIKALRDSLMKPNEGYSALILSLSGSKDEPTDTEKNK